MKASDRRKWILPAGIVLALIIIYFLPIPVTQTDRVSIRAPYEKTWEQISSLQRWRNWWPDTAGINTMGDTVFNTPRSSYQLRNKQTLHLVLEQPGMPVYHVLTLIPGAHDTSCTLQWETISYLRKAVSDKVSALFGSNRYTPSKLLQQVKESMEDPVKYYGFPIRVQPVEDTFILVIHSLATKAAIPARVQQLYGSLQQHLDSLGYTGRAEKMFHVDSLRGDTVEVMAGLSLAKPVAANAPFRLMTMPRAHIVVGEYEGNYKDIYRIHQAVVNFMKDHNIAPVAVVYEKMLGNPHTAQDSLRVRVKVYHPPMIP